MNRLIDLDTHREAVTGTGPRRTAPARWSSAVLVAMCVLMLGAGGPPGPNLEPRHIVAGEFARLVLDDTHAFTVRGASASSRIDAYGLDDGEHRWSTAVHGTVIRMLADAGVLVVSADDTVALDAATGKVRWRQSAASLLGRSGDVAVVSTVPGVIGGLSGWRPTDATRAPEVVLWHRMPAGGALFAVHNAQTGRRTMVGRMTGWPTTPTCELGAAHLVCYGGDELAIWRRPATS